MDTLEPLWLDCTDDPQAMLDLLRQGGKLTDRKARLFAVACCRPFLPLLRDPRVGDSLDMAEQFADGLVGDSERSAARKLAQQAAQVRGVVQRPDAPKWERRAASLAYYAAARQAGEAAWNIPALAVEVLVRRAGGFDACDPRAIKKSVGGSQAQILRDIFGPQPFRPLPTLPPSVRIWNDDCVARLASAIYEERSLPEGTLDPHRLAVLADALEEAGCDDVSLIEHLRGPGPHYRGCHAVDAILLRE